MSALSVTLGADISSLKTAMEAAVGKVNETARKMAKSLVGHFAAGELISHGMEKGFEIGWEGIKRAAETAPEFEKLATTFAPLLGSMDAARERFGELVEFTASTPFELPAVVEASRKLELLTHGMLSTEEGMKLVGDAASAAGAPIDEVATSVGRVYDSIQAGGNGGRGLMQLQKLGIVSTAVREKIAELASSGVGVNAVWETLSATIGRFGGSMKIHAGTWLGMMKNFRETVSEVLAAFGQPIMDSLKPYLEYLTQRVQSLREAGSKIGESIGNGLSILRAAFMTGSVMRLFGAGIMVGIIDGVNAFSKGVRDVVRWLGAALHVLFSGMGDALASDRLRMLLTNIFDALGSLIRSHLEAGAAAIAASIGRVGAASDLRQASAQSKQRADLHFGAARAGLEGTDLGSVLEGAARTIAAAVAAGNKAVADGNANGVKPLLDDSIAKLRLEDVLVPLRKIVEDWRNENKGSMPMPPPALDGGDDNEDGDKSAGHRLEPIVSTLGKVGGGGYDSGVLDAQRENNKLTVKTNELLTDLNKSVDKLGAKQQRATFG